MRWQGRAKTAEFRLTTKSKKFQWGKNHEPGPKPKRDAILHARYTKVRKTGWGSFAHLRVFPREMQRSSRPPLVRPRSTDYD
jgi:hypothetical protein